MFEEKNNEGQRSFWSAKHRWFLDMVLGISAFVVIVTSLYFMYLPAGYQGGRNPYYGIRIVFERDTWDVLHTWGGILMILIALVHVAVHWKWFSRMGRRTWQQICGKTGKLNTRGIVNLWTNILLGVSFLLCALSGVYFLFVPGSHQAIDPGFLFSRVVWDLIHTWSGVLMIASVLMHFLIHWNWVINTAGRLLQSGLGVFRRAEPYSSETIVKA